jgi:hypothetical protein
VKRRETQRPREDDSAPGREPICQFPTGGAQPDGRSLIDRQAAFDPTATPLTRPNALETTTTPATHSPPQDEIVTPPS